MPEQKIGIDNPKLLKVGVVIPVFNEQEIIGGVLDAIPRGYSGPHYRC